MTNQTYPNGGQPLAPNSDCGEDFADLQKALNYKTQQLDRALAALRDIGGVLDESYGVAGYHLNGEVAPWSSFEEFGGCTGMDALIADIAGEGIDATH